MPQAHNLLISSKHMIYLKGSYEVKKMELSWICRGVLEKKTRELLNGYFSEVRKMKTIPWN